MVSDTFHVYPVNDLVEHDTSGEPCVCGPDTEAVIRDDGSNGWLVTHHSLDGREVHEVVIAEITAHAERDAPNECVGLIGSDHAGRPAVFPLSNVAAHPEHNFEVAPTQLHEALAAMQDAGYTLHTIYHSHPTSPAVPSPADNRFAVGWPGIQWLIVSLTDEQPIRTWMLDGPEPIELLE